MKLPLEGHLVLNSAEGPARLAKYDPVPLDRIAGFPV